MGFLSGLFSAQSEKKQLLSQNWQQLRYVVIDLELTGLNPKKHEIVSLAWVTIEQQRIYPAHSVYCLNKEVTQLEQSPVFHGISQAELQAQGQTLQTGLQQLIAHAQNSVLIFHHALLDWGFLQHALQQHTLSLSPVIVDTLKLEQQRLQKQGKEIAQNDLTLSASRARYKLPRYTEHNALSDALATAELFLAQANSISASHPLPLKQLIH